MHKIRLPLFMGFIVIAGFLNFPVSKKHVKPNHMPWYDFVLMMLGAGCFFYLYSAKGQLDRAHSALCRRSDADDSRHNLRPDRSCAHRRYCPAAIFPEEKSSRIRNSRIAKAPPDACPMVLSACRKSLFAPLPVQFFKLIKFEKLLD